MKWSQVESAAVGKLCAAGNCCYWVEGDKRKSVVVVRRGEDRKKGKRDKGRKTKLDRLGRGCSAVRSYICVYFPNLLEVFIACKHL